MKRIITIVIATSVFAPAITLAMVVNTSASSHTGGVTAGQGETVLTGSSESSSNIKTVIISDETGGTADVQITNTQNGVQSVEKKHYDMPAGKAVSIQAATTSSVKARPRASSTIPVVTTASSSNATISQERSESVFMAWLNHAPRSLTSFLSRFLSLFSE